MSYKIYNERTIKAATGQLMALINFSFCEFGMKLALEGGLSDLKGLVAYDSYTGVEFELLESLNDPVIRTMLNSIQEMTDAFGVFVMINSLDELEIIQHETGTELAEALFYGYIMDPLPNDRYADIICDITYLYQTTTFMLYVMALLFTHGRIDLDSDDFENYWNDIPEDQELHSLDTSNKNISLLHELIVNRQAVKQEMNNYL